MAYADTYYAHRTMIDIKYSGLGVLRREEEMNGVGEREIAETWGRLGLC